jgi:plastocyanin
MKRLVVVVAALLAFTACSSSTSHKAPGSQPAGSTSGRPSGPTITIKNFGYSGTLTVKAGAKVTVVNDDSVQHSLTDKKTHRFDTGLIGPGASGSFTAPTQPGKYPFGCTIHPEMAGTLTVTS